MEPIANQWLRNHDRMFWLLFLWVAAVMFSVPSVRADIYIWQDDQGVIHFSNQDAPPAASLYMREPEPVVAMPTQTPAAQAPSTSQEQIQARLERTNRQLERALDRVDELTDKVRDSQQEAAVAAAVAQQAAQVSTANAVQTAREPDYEVRERVVYYAAPYIRHLPGKNGFHRKRHHFKRHKFNLNHRKFNLNHRKFNLNHRKFNLNHRKFNLNHRKSHHGKFGQSGRNIHHKLNHRRSIHHKPGRSISHRIRIHKAYGIR